MSETTPERPDGPRSDKHRDRLRKAAPDPKKQAAASKVPAPEKADPATEERDS
jgi:hypothetical protein